MAEALKKTAHTLRAHLREHPVTSFMSIAPLIVTAILVFRGLT